MTNLSILRLIFLMGFLFINSVMAQDKNIVSTLSSVNGTVSIKKLDGKTIDAVKDMGINEGDIINTEKSSFVKLSFIDKSIITVGPNSSFKVTAFSKSEAGILTLIKGSIRAQVTKDYMELEDKEKSKLFIKTETAAMGIRGTDFQVSHNAQTGITDLLTIEGRVAMNKLPSEMQSKNLNQRDLDTILDRKDRRMVTNGFRSSVALGQQRPSEPMRIEKGQLDSLKKERVPRDESRPEKGREQGKGNEQNKEQNKDQNKDQGKGPAKEQGNDQGNGPGNGPGVNGPGKRKGSNNGPINGPGNGPGNNSDENNTPPQNKNNNGNSNGNNNSQNQKRDQNEAPPRRDNQGASNDRKPPPPNH
jgi:hypothetical protein